ncbi:hypothetical protein BMS3Abin07_02119 [bacterium BMS3Abin07]|nr:hypothetical protein BMS3Abin07_02119 [bacterium BMS3Abin07]GBE32540.1 hypothetical protein BMS3Bbin05_01456 [bacterium BMS3Bbin05]HDO23593.1 hypothetical protein [Nitrospirota bacterium]HDZ87111.1 hypothetical protein [Nitrospirota bacterium]
MNNTINKKERTAQILVYINYAAIILLVYLIYRFKFDPFSVGGSLMLAAFIFMLIFFKRVVKPLALESSSAALMITGIVVINFLSYWEISGQRIDMPYLIIAFLCLYFFVAISSAVLGLPFKKIDSVSETERQVYRQIMRTLSMPMYVFGLIFAMLSGLAVYDILKSEPNAAISCPLLKISYMAVFWIVIAFLVIYIYLSKIKDDDIRKFLLEEKFNIVNYDIKKVKKYYTIFFFLIIFFGSVVETQRGMWVMWIETILLLGLMSLIIWKIYKHVFYIDQEKTTISSCKGL